MYSNKAGSSTVYMDIRMKIDKIRKFLVIRNIVDKSICPEHRKRIRMYIDELIKDSVIIKRIAKSRAEKLDKLSGRNIKYLSNMLRTDIEALEQFWQCDLSH